MSTLTTRAAARPAATISIAPLASPSKPISPAIRDGAEIADVRSHMSPGVRRW
jgi:hypothetical protein